MVKAFYLQFRTPPQFRVQPRTRREGSGQHGIRCSVYSNITKALGFQQKVAICAGGTCKKSFERDRARGEAHRGIHAGTEVQKYIDTRREKEMLSCCDGWLNSNHYFLGIRFADSAITAHSKKRVAKTVNPEL